MSRETKQDLIARLIYEARAAEGATATFDEAAFDALGINRTDGRCLDFVSNEGSITAGRLAQKMGLTTAAVTSVLDRLEKKGYARRVRDADDRRRVIVEVTPEFMKRAARIWGPIFDEASRKVFSKMTADDLRVVTEWFRRDRELNEEQVERVRNLKLD